MMQIKEKPFSFVLKHRSRREEKACGLVLTNLIVGIQSFKTKKVIMINQKPGQKLVPKKQTNQQEKVYHSDESILK